MAVQVRVTTTVIGEGRVELAPASFGYVEPSDLPEAPTEQSPADRVLQPDSSTLAPGLSLQIA